MSNAPVSLATTTPASLPSPARRNMARLPQSHNLQQPVNLSPVIAEFYRASPIAREEWAKEMQAKPVKVRTQIKPKKKSLR